MSEYRLRIDSARSDPDGAGSFDDLSLDTCCLGYRLN
jgi:hypothetical protein